MTTETGSQSTSLDSAAPVADTLDADIAAAYDKAEGGETQTTETEKPDVSEAARTLAAARKSAAATEGEDTTQAATGTDSVEGAKGADTVTGAQATDTIEAPQHWPAADREMFAKQTPEAKQWLLNRHKAMEADYTRKTQEFSGVRRFKEQLDEIMGPYRDAMAREGIDDAQAIRQLVAAHDYLQRDPQNAIHWLAQKYGIDLKAPQAGAETTTGQPDPTVQRLQQTVAQLERTLNTTLSAQQKEQHQALLTQVEQFANEKDAQGQPLRPHFEEVAGDIALLIKAARGNGETLALQDAYDRAVYANPTTRAKVLAAQEAQRQKREAEERAAKANAAKKAAFDVRGTGAATTVVASNDSIEAALEAAYDAAGGRV